MPRSDNTDKSRVGHDGGRGLVMCQIVVKRVTRHITGLRRGGHGTVVMAWILKWHASLKYLFSNRDEFHVFTKHQYPP